MALKNIHLHPKEIWEKISKEMNGIQRTWHGMTDSQVSSRVRNVRVQIQGSNLLRNIENLELAQMKNLNKFFLQFNCTKADDRKE